MSFMLVTVMDINNVIYLYHIVIILINNNLHGQLIYNVTVVIGIFLRRSIFDSLCLLVGIGVQDRSPVGR